jgi:hypothetical protein
MKSRPFLNPMAKNAIHLKRLRLLAVVGVLGLMACKLRPSYKADRLAEDLKKMVAQDYKLDIETRLAGDNLQAQFFRVGLLKSQETEIDAEAAEALERVLLCAIRISLSTDAPLQFLEVKLIDALTGSSITLWRFVPDIRDSMYIRMAETEYLNRLVVEIDADHSLTKEWKEVKWDPPLTMAQFIAKQVVLRAKRSSTVGLQAHEDLSDPATLTIVLDNWSLIEKEVQGQEVTDLLEKTMKTVVGGYRFSGFREFVLKDGRGLPIRRGVL